MVRVKKWEYSELLYKKFFPSTGAALSEDRRIRLVKERGLESILSEFGKINLVPDQNCNCLYYACGLVHGDQLKVVIAPPTRKNFQHTDLMVPDSATDVYVNLTPEMEFLFFRYKDILFEVKYSFSVEEQESVHRD